MRRRLYFLVPDVVHCKALVADLRNQGISDKQIHVIARNDVELEGLNQATALQKTELAHGLEWGIGLGGVAGLLGGLLAVTFPPAGILLAGEAILLGTTLAGAGFGAVVSALVAGDIPNQELEHFQDKIALGEILLLLDIPTPHVEIMMHVIKLHHPKAEIGVLNPNTL